MAWRLIFNQGSKNHTFALGYSRCTVRRRLGLNIQQAKRQNPDLVEHVAGNSLKLPRTVIKPNAKLGSQDQPPLTNPARRSILRIPKLINIALAAVVHAAHMPRRSSRRQRREIPDGPLGPAVHLGPTETKRKLKLRSSQQYFFKINAAAHLCSLFLFVQGILNSVRRSAVAAFHRRATHACGSSACDWLKSKLTVIRYLPGGFPFSLLVFPTTADALAMGWPRERGSERFKENGPWFSRARPQPSSRLGNLRTKLVGWNLGDGTPKNANFDLHSGTTVIVKRPRRVGDLMAIVKDRVDDRRRGKAGTSLEQSLKSEGHNPKFHAVEKPQPRIKVSRMQGRWQQCIPGAASFDLGRHHLENIISADTGPRFHVIGGGGDSVPPNFKVGY
ncbi:hypothetical protein DFH06DRAFT_1132244 [Mycena polygramma]|nr:hypothetical protein DFH06DRAFT_1132244 [Mycena polygramma]